MHIDTHVKIHALTRMLAYVTSKREGEMTRSESYANVHTQTHTRDLKPKKSKT